MRPFLYGRIICVNQSFKYSPSTAYESFLSIVQHPHQTELIEINTTLIQWPYTESILIWIYSNLYRGNFFRFPFSACSFSIWPILSPHKYARAHTIHTEIYRAPSPLMASINLYGCDKCFFFLAYSVGGGKKSMVSITATWALSHICRYCDKQQYECGMGLGKFLREIDLKCIECCRLGLPKFLTLCFVSLSKNGSICLSMKYLHTFFIVRKRSIVIYLKGKNCWIFFEQL